MDRSTPMSVAIVALLAGCFDPTEDPQIDVSSADGTSSGSGGGTAVEAGDPDSGPGGNTASTTSSADVTGDPTDGSTDPTGNPSSEPTNDTTDPTGDPTDATQTTEPTDTDPSSDATDPTTGEGPCVPQCGNAVCGDDPVCGDSCGTCDFGETCLDDGEFCGMEYGFPEDFGFSAEVAPDVLFGHRFTLPAASTLKRFGVIANGVGTVRMVLYADAAGPQARVAESDPIDVVAGSNEQSVDDVALAAGDYWVGVISFGSTPLRVTAPGDDSYEMFYRLQSYADPFPVTLVGESVVNDYRYNLYVVVDDG